MELDCEAAEFSGCRGCCGCCCCCCVGGVDDDVDDVTVDDARASTPAMLSMLLADDDGPQSVSSIKKEIHAHIKAYPI